MAPLLYCEFNIDTTCVELKFSDGSMISINCTAVEDEVAKNMYPVEYADLILNGDPEEYLRKVTDYSPLD